MTRTISPLSIDNAGGSFDVVVKIEIANGDATLGTLSENYQSAENMQNWTISNIYADPAFIQYVDGVPGLYEWSAGFSLMSAGIYHINYTMTIGDPEPLGTYEISGSWVDIDNADGIPVTGDTQVTIEGIPVFTSTDWPLIGKGLYNNAVTSDRAPVQKPDDSGSWSTMTYGAGFSGIDVHPLVVGDMVYVATQGSVFAVDRNTGEIEWQNDIVEGATAPLGTPAYGNGKLFVAAFSHLYAYDAISGNELLNVTIDSENQDFTQMNTPVMYEDGRIFFGEWIPYGEYNRKYYCYNEAGTLDWTYVSPTGKGYYWAGTAIVGRYMIFGDDALHLTSLDKYDGTVVDEINVSELLEIGYNGERAEIRNPIAYSPDTGRIYSASEAGYCFSIGFNVDGTFNTLDTHKSYIGKSTCTPTVYNGRVYVGTGTFTGSGDVYCLNEEDLSEIWKYTPNGGVQGSPVISTAYDDGDGEVYIYFTTNVVDARVYCLKDYTGNTEPELQWYYEAPSEKNEYTLHGVTIKDGRIFYGNDLGYLFGLAEWNPWNDIGSEGSPDGTYITLTEVIDAYNCFRNGTSAPKTEAAIDLTKVIDMYNAFRYGTPM